MTSEAQRRIKSISYAKFGYYFILPFFIIYLLFQFWPLINTFVIGFKGNIKPDENQAASYATIDEFVGGENIKGLLTGKANSTKVEDIAAGAKGSVGVGPSRSIQKTSDSFWLSLKNTFILWFGNFIPQILLSLLLAVWFTDAKIKIPGKGFFKVVMYLPNIITAASVAILFKTLLSDVENYPGPINALFLNFVNNPLNIKGNEIPITFIRDAAMLNGVVDGTPTQFVNNFAMAPRAAVMFIQTWMWFGNTMLMLMSGIMGINASLFEAADIDGASSWQVFRHITLPLLRPIMLYTLVTSMIGGLQMFDIPLLYRSGAQFTTINPNVQTIAVFIYRNFNNSISVDNAWGTAGAASVILFIMTSILGAVAFYFNRDKDAIAKKKQIKKLIKQEKMRAQKVTLGREL